MLVKIVIKKVDESSGEGRVEPKRDLPFLSIKML
jgi:hypothetical protein